MLGAAQTNQLAEHDPMALERTFSIIKPDATKRNLTGKITAKFDEAGLRVVASKRIQLTLACLLYTSPSPRDRQKSRMPSSA